MTSERGFIWLGLTYDPASGTSAYLSDGRDASTDLVLAPLAGRECYGVEVAIGAGGLQARVCENEYALACQRA